MKDIYSLKPVNKISALVVSQTNCSDNINTNNKEKRDALGQQKRHFADLCENLKKKIGINRAWKKGQPLPPYIYKNPEYPILLGIIEKLSELDKELTILNKNKIDPKTFERIFLDIAKEKYPKIYDEIMRLTFKKYHKD